MDQGLSKYTEKTERFWGIIGPVSLIDFLEIVGMAVVGGLGGVLLFEVLRLSEKRRGKV